MGYLYVQFDYLHRIISKIGVNSVNMMSFTLFTHFTPNVGVNGVNSVNGVYHKSLLVDEMVSLPDVKGVNGVNTIQTII